MLVLTRRPGESVTIGEDIVVTVLSVNGSQVRVGIAAPRSMQVLREEIYKATQEENRAAAQGVNLPRLLEDVLPHMQGKRKRGEKA